MIPAIIAAVIVTAVVTYLLTRLSASSSIAEKDRQIASRDASIAAGEALIKEIREQNERNIEALRQEHDKALGAQIRQIRSQMEADNARLQKEREESLKKEAAETMKGIAGNLGEDIRKMKESFEAQKKSNAEGLASISTKFEETAKAISSQSQEIGKKAESLATALRSNHKYAGNWGEMRLQNIMDDEGFIKGRDYDTEVTLVNEAGERVYNDETGKSMRPDLILHFPDGSDVIVDSKVSLDALMDYCGTEDAAVKEEAAERNLRAIRDQIKNLSSKSYHDYHRRKGLKTLDYVLMFVPNYGAYQLAKSLDANLFSEAFRQNVLITTEETIMPFLRMIHTAWRNQEQINGMEEIVRQATYMVDRVAAFSEAHRKMGQKIQDAAREYDRCDHLLKEEGQSILHAAKAVRDCGIKVNPKKELPD